MDSETLEPPRRWIELAYEELRAVAAQVLRGERDSLSLAPTALVHEVFLQLHRVDESYWKDRQHFLAVATRAIRRALVNHAEARTAQRRGRGWKRAELEDAARVLSGPDDQILALQEALSRLERIEPRGARVVELRFFGGLTVEEVSRLLGIAVRTVEADWTYCRAWLRRELSRNEAEGGAAHSAPKGH